MCAAFFDRPGHPAARCTFRPAFTADGKLIATKTDGELLLIKPDTAGINVLARARPFPGSIRALPALSGGRLYVRDDHTLKCLLVKPMR